MAAVLVSVVVSREVELLLLGLVLVWVAMHGVVVEWVGILWVVPD